MSFIILYLTLLTALTLLSSSTRRALQHIYEIQGWKKEDARIVTLW